MNSPWRVGKIQLMPGYTLLDNNNERTNELAEVSFAIEGGYVNVRVPGRDDIQLVSAPAVRWIICHEETGK